MDIRPLWPTKPKLKAFTLRYPSSLEARLNAATAAHSVSKNQFIVQLLERELVTR